MTKYSFTVTYVINCFKPFDIFDKLPQNQILNEVLLTFS